VQGFHHGGRSVDKALAARRAACPDTAAAPSARHHGLVLCGTPDFSGLHRAAVQRQSWPVLSVLIVTFPFFALVLCGYIATRGGVLPLSAISGLNTFVLFFALPCMLYRFGAQTPIAQLLDPVVAGVYLLCGLALVAATLALTLRRWGWNDAAFGALVAAFPNSGFMGVPLLVALLGEGSAGPVILTMALDMVITTSLCIALSRLGEGEGGAVQALRKALRGMRPTPCPGRLRWGSGIGPGVRAARPHGQDRGHAGGRCLAGGAVHHRGGAGALADEQHERWPRATMCRLHWSSCSSTRCWSGPPARRPWRWACRSTEAMVVLVLLSALPSASNVSLLTERYGAHSGRVARIILVAPRWPLSLLGGSDLAGAGRVAGSPDRTGFSACRVWEASLAGRHPDLGGAR
jgi:hypothetical protein